MSAEEAYQLYCQYNNRFLRWTNPVEADNMMPEKESGKTVYEFHGSKTLADFLTFVLEQKV